MKTNRLQSRVRADRHQSIFIFGVHTLTPTLRSNGAFFLIPKKEDSNKQKVHVDLMSLHLKKTSGRTPVPQCPMLFCKKEYACYLVQFRLK